MKVCAHITTSNGNGHDRFNTIRDAVEDFRGFVWDYPTEWGTLDLYPQCDECDSHMNFHDYPMVRYELGPRGGINRVSV